MTYMYCDADISTEVSLLILWNKNKETNSLNAKEDDDMPHIFSLSKEYNWFKLCLALLPVLIIVRHTAFKETDTN